jgi:hypothetical protein
MSYVQCEFVVEPGLDCSCGVYREVLKLSIVGCIDRWEPPGREHPRRAKIGDRGLIAGSASPSLTPVTSTKSHSLKLPSTVASCHAPSVAPTVLYLSS